MFEAQLLVAKDASYDVYSPWFPRGGNNATFTVDVVEVDGATITVKVYTKKTADEGEGSEADNTKSLSQNAVGRDAVTWTKTLKELVRYKFSITGASAGDWVLFRMLPPVWFDSAQPE